MNNENEKRILKIFGQNVKKYREEKGVTLQELSERTGIRKQYIIKIMNGESPGITTKHLFLLAEALGISSCELVTGI